MQEHQHHNRHYLILAFILSLSIIILLIASILIIKPRIESDLTKKVTEQLKLQGIVAQVSFSGRDGIIKGIVKKADIKKAEKSANEVCGIHFIDNQLIARGAQKSTQATVIKSATPPSSLEQAVDTDKKLEAVTVQKNDQSPVDVTKDVANNPRNHEKQKEEKAELARSRDKSKEDLKPSEEKATKKSLVTKALSEGGNRDKATPSEPENNERKSSAKGNLLAYEKMLTAMDDYNKSRKSRNKRVIADESSFGVDTKAISFKSDSVKIKSNSYAVLDKLAKRLEETDEKDSIKITVTAKESDLAFSRAKSLQAYLVEKGIEKRRLVITGKGSDKGDSVSITKL